VALEDEAIADCAVMIAPAGLVYPHGVDEAVFRAPSGVGFQALWLLLFAAGNFGTCFDVAVATASARIAAVKEILAPRWASPEPPRPFGEKRSAFGLLELATRPSGAYLRGTVAGALACVAAIIVRSAFLWTASRHSGRRQLEKFAALWFIYGVACDLCASQSVTVLGAATGIAPVEECLAARWTELGV